VGTEASLHAVEDYMEWAEFWFRVEENRRRTKLKRRAVFIATDDKNVVKEARQKYVKSSSFFCVLETDREKTAYNFCNNRPLLRAAGYSVWFIMRKRKKLHFKSFSTLYGFSRAVFV
jgi:hypothetical protein